MTAERRKPAAPSPRVYIAFGIACIIGVAVFLIWWGSSSALRQDEVGRTTGDAAPETKPAPAGAVLDEPGLPHGGTLTGSTDALDLAITRLTQATLVRIHRGTDRVEPWLAESWTASPDSRTYILKLRPGVRWSDGTPFTVEDAVASLGKVMVRAAAGKSAGQPLAARAMDPLAVEIRFPVAFAPGLRLLDHQPILSRHKQTAEAGLGPFVMERPEGPGSHTFVRNPHYWRRAPDGSPLPYLDGLTLGPGSPGQHDFADSPVPPDAVEEMRKLEQAGKLRLFDLGPGLSADALWFSPPAKEAGDARQASGEPGRQWLTSETFRLAVSTTVDRREYCKQVFFGACDPIAGPVTPANAAWFNPDMPVGGANPPIARGMLAGLGLRDRTGDGMLEDGAQRPVRFSLLINRDVPSAARAAAFIADSLRGIGVLVDIAPVSADALRVRRQKGSYDAIYDRIDMRDTDPAMNLDFWLSSGEAHVWNPARSRPADWERQIDRLMMKNASSFDRIERLQAFVDAQKIYHQHMPALFFGAPYVRIATTIRTLNATPSLLKPHLLWNAERLGALK
jgi:peptide/nickel transport system substrate-binding protein